MLVNSEMWTYTYRNLSIKFFTAKTWKVFSASIGTSARDAGGPTKVTLGNVTGL